jgi:hypothetical protein
LDVAETPHLAPAKRIYPSPAQTADKRLSRSRVAAIAADAGLLVTLGGVAAMFAQSKGVFPAESWRWGVVSAVLGALVFAFGVLRLATLARRQAQDVQTDVASLRAELAKLRKTATSGVGVSPSPAAFTRRIDVGGLPRPFGANPRVV